MTDLNPNELDINHNHEEDTTSTLSATAPPKTMPESSETEEKVEETTTTPSPTPQSNQTTQATPSPSPPASIEQTQRTQKTRPRTHRRRTVPVPNLPFHNSIREMVHRHRSDFLIRNSAINTLYECAEAYMIGVFEHANLQAIREHRLEVRRLDLVSALAYMESHYAGLLQGEEMGPD